MSALEPLVISRIAWQSEALHPLWPCKPSQVPCYPSSITPEGRYHQINSFSSPLSSTRLSSRLDTTYCSCSSRCMIYISRHRSHRAYPRTPPPNPSDVHIRNDTLGDRSHTENSLHPFVLPSQKSSLTAWERASPTDHKALLLVGVDSPPWY